MSLKDDLFGFYHKIQFLYPQFERTYMRKCGYKAILAIFFSPMILIINLVALFRLKCRKIKYVFIGTHHKDLIESLPESEVLVFGSIKNWFNFRGNYIFVTYEILYIYLCAVYFLKLNKLLVPYSFIFAFKKSSASIVVTGNDTKPLERIFLLFAKRLRLKNVVIQHGLWIMEKLEGYQLDGWYAENIIVYDEYHKELLVGFGMQPQKIFVFGFPKKIVSKVEKVRFTNDVCIIGVGFGLIDKYSDSLIVNNSIYDALKNGGFSNIFYKPHPNEKHLEIDRDVFVYKKSISQAAKDFSFFIGSASTALIDLRLNGKHVIQFFAPQLGVLDFCKLGYLKSKMIGIDTITIEDFQNNFVCNINLDFNEFTRRFVEFRTLRNKI